ncbi:hypothetical protein BTHE_0704 [Bifidobacterium thermophilum]|nr:hypothetical protein BTHE_0704 [Bifidobacterium thermophilum]
MLSRAYRYERMSLGLGLPPIWRVAYVDTCVVGPTSFLRCHRVRIGSHDDILPAQLSAARQSSSQSIYKKGPLCESILTQRAFGPRKIPGLSRVTDRAEHSPTEPTELTG